MHVDIEADQGVATFVYDGRQRRWLQRPPLPADVLGRLEAAGDKAQATAERRYAGTLKRQATIEAGNIRVGRPHRGADQPRRD